MARITSLADWAIENLGDNKLAYLCETILLDMKDNDVFDFMSDCDFDYLVHRCEACDDIFDSEDDLIDIGARTKYCQDCAADHDADRTATEEETTNE